MISGQLKPQGVQTTWWSCPFKLNTFLERLLFSWGALADKRFFFYNLSWKCAGKRLCVILQLHKNVHGGTCVQPNQNICSRAHKTLCSKQSHKSGFWDLERGSDCKGKRLYREKITSLCPCFGHLGFLVGEGKRERKENLRVGERFITAGQV